MKGYKPWSEEDQLKLIQVINVNRKPTGKVDWDKVLLCFPERSKQQCKSYFNNILKEDASLDLVTYHRWNEKEQRFIVDSIDSKKLSWEELVRYFPTISISTLKTQYHYALKKFGLLKEKKQPQMFQEWQNELLKEPDVQQLIRQLASQFK